MSYTRVVYRERKGAPLKGKPWGRGTVRGWKHTDEAKAKIAAANKARIANV